MCSPKGVLMERTTLEVTDLKQWRYCPRVVWYRYCLPTIRPITDLMRHGIAHHRDEEGREERRSLRAYGLEVGERHFDVALQSEQLGLRGRIDLVIAVPEQGGRPARQLLSSIRIASGRPGHTSGSNWQLMRCSLRRRWGMAGTRPAGCTTSHYAARSGCRSLPCFDDRCIRSPALSRQ